MADRTKSDTIDVLMSKKLTCNGEGSTTMQMLSPDTLAYHSIVSIVTG